MLLGQFGRGDVLALVAPGVADQVCGVVLDDVVQRLIEALVAVLGADVEDVGAGRHSVHGLDVEGLLAVPAGLAAALRLQAERSEHLLAVLPGREARTTGEAGVGVGVGLHGRRRVGVGDGDGDSVPVTTLGDRALHAVGTLQLVRRVAAAVGRVLGLAAVRLGHRLGVLPVELRALRRRGSGGRLALRRRSGDPLAERSAQQCTGVEAGDPGDRRGDRRGDRYGLRRGAQLAALPRVVLQLSPEGPVDLRCRTGGLDPAIALRHRGHGEALCLQEVSHSVHGPAGRGEAGVELCRAHVMPVLRASRCGHGLCQPLRTGRVAQRQDDREGDRLAGREISGGSSGLCPRGLGAGERHPGSRRRSAGGRGQEW